MPRFRKKFCKKRIAASSGRGSDYRGYKKEKEDRGLRSSSLKYKDDIDSV
ncbi:MAG: hypothetical protein K6E59_00750 [Bacilli bacterium]|nr:hypothetical protein [Bacilli bacterium]